MLDDTDVTHALAEAARDLSEPRDVQATLDAIVRSARESLPGVDHVGVSVLNRDGGVETMAATDDLVWKLDALQYEMGEGPCLWAVDQGNNEDIVLVENARHEQRWPRFMPRALQAGLRAQMGLQLHTGEGTLGGLNLYSVEADCFPEGTREAAEVFAAVAAAALGRSRREDHLTTALQTRQVTGQAVGIVMERYRLTEQRAWEYLVRVSSHSNTKLREVARQVVAQTEANAEL
jgi:transcriptional regulator with GAF, ATPase, and Fis domain